MLPHGLLSDRMRTWICDPQLPSHLSFNLISHAHQIWTGQLRRPHECPVVPRHSLVVRRITSEVHIQTEEAIPCVVVAPDIPTYVLGLIVIGRPWVHRN